MVKVFSGLCVSVCVFLVFIAAQAQESATRNSTTVSASDVTGLWYLDDNSQVNISLCGDSVCGILEWFPELETVGGPILDTNNPDEMLQARELKGLQLIFDFKRTKKGWRKGKIYDPESGKTYKSKLTRIDEDHLKVEGCVGPFCQKFLWTRQAKKQ